MSVEIETSVDSYMLRKTIESLQNHIEMQMQMISDARRMYVLQKEEKPKLSFVSQQIAEFEPPDPRLRNDYLFQKMQTIAIRLKQMKIEKHNSKIEIQEALDITRQENLILEERIKRLLKRQSNN